MAPLEDPIWIDALECIEYAFQPIVNIYSGECLGYEALLREWKPAGFDSIQAVFDAAAAAQVLHQVDMVLREKAIAKFAAIAGGRLKLFFNLDNRMLGSRDYTPGATASILSRYGLTHDRICFEISEKHELPHSLETTNLLTAYHRQGFRIAVDDFGAGFSGLKLLYHAEPDFLKIDRFFIQQIAGDAKKRLFVSSIVNIAHMIGSLVIAEGVESAEEYLACRDIGCDLIQGFLVARPTVDPTSLKARYPIIETLNGRERRDRAQDDQPRIASHMTTLLPLPQDATMLHICQAFKEDRHDGYFPIVNADEEPLGIVRESDLKQYTYSRYGQELLQNPAFGGSITRFIRRAPIADIHTPVEKIVGIYSQSPAIEGILIVEGMRYQGILSPQSLLRVINEKNLAAARDQNPLSRLPGNILIHEFVTAALMDKEHPYYLVYFDFDNFKPFNDHYGFRQGDRIILLFAEILRSMAQETGGMAGHVGGDDFFFGLRGQFPIDEIVDRISALTRRFARDAESFYDAETRRRGYLEAADRSGDLRRLPLLRASAVVLKLPPMRRDLYSAEELGRAMAILKKAAKASSEGLCLGLQAASGSMDDAFSSDDLATSAAMVAVPVYLLDRPDAVPHPVAHRSAVADARALRAFNAFVTPA